MVLLPLLVSRHLCYRMVLRGSNERPSILSSEQGSLSLLYSSEGSSDSRPQLGRAHHVAHQSASTNSASSPSGMAISGTGSGSGHSADSNHPLIMAAAINAAASSSSHNSHSQSHSHSNSQSHSHSLSHSLLPLSCLSPSPFRYPKHIVHNVYRSRKGCYHS